MSSTTRITSVNCQLFIVMRTTVHPSPCYDVYSCWEPSGLAGRHCALTRSDNLGWLGRVGSRRWESDLPAMSDERTAAFDDHHTAECSEAYEAIVRAFPEAKDGARDSGEITVV